MGDLTSHEASSRLNDLSFTAMQWVILKEQLVNLPPRQLKKVLEILLMLFKVAFIRNLGFMKGRLMSSVLCTVHSLLRYRTLDKLLSSLGLSLLTCKIKVLNRLRYLHGSLKY